MSSDMYYEAAVSAVKAPSRSDRILRRLLVVLVLILGVELLWLFGISPCMPFSGIEVRGLPELSDGEIIARAGIDASSSYINVNCAKSEAALESLYMVESAVVKKRFPDRLTITLKPRSAAALAFAEYGGRVSPVFFDREGVVFKIGAAEAELKALGEKLPIISGLVFENLSPGARLPENLRPLLMNLELINSRNPVLLSLISELRVHKKTYDGYELVLYPAYTPIRFRLGPELSEETLKYMMLIIDVLKRQGLDDEIDEIDFRTGAASYKTKEAHSG